MNTRRPASPARRDAIMRFNELNSKHDIRPDCPDELVDLPQSLGEAKPLVYADIGIIAADVIDVTLAPELLDDLHSCAETPAILNNWYREVLIRNTEFYTKWACPHLRHEMAEYENDFRKGVSTSLLDPATNLVIRGINTYISTITKIYHTLRHLDANPAPSPDQIHGSYRILDSLAKLHISQFLAYAESNLPTDNLPNHIELNPASTGYQFKPGAIADAHYMHYSIDGSEEPSVRRIGDIDTNESQVGCPVTFRPGTTRKLWEFYVEARLGSDYTPPAASTPTSAAE